MTDKISKRELKGPDQLQVKFFGFVDWLEKQKTPIGIAFGVIALGVAGYWGFMSWQKSKMQARVNALAEVAEVYKKEKESVDKKKADIQKKITDVDAKIGAATPEKPADPKLADEKKALETEFAAVNGDFSESIKKFDEYFRANTDNPEGWLAGVRAARLHADKGGFQEARDILDIVISKSVANPFFQLQARFLLVSVLEELGDFDAATKHAETLLSLANDDLKPKVLLTKGRLLMLKNASTEAQESLKLILDKHPTSAEAQKARAMLVILNNG